MASSKTEVIKRALAVYDLLESEKQRGCRIFLRDKDGNEREVLLL